MSVKAMSAAFDAGATFNLSAIDRLILLRIGDWADDYGYAWPGVSGDLIAMVGVDERTIRRHISAMAGAGLIDRVYEGGGRSRPTLYRILPSILPDAADAPGKLRYQERFLNGDSVPPFRKGAASTTKGDQRRHKGGRGSVPRSVKIHQDPSAFEIDEPEIPRLPGETPVDYFKRLTDLP